MKEEDKTEIKPSNKKENKPKVNIYWIYAIIAIIFIAISFFDFGNSANLKINWQTFNRDMLQHHDVEKLVIINKQKVEVHIKKHSFQDKRYNKYRGKDFGFEKSKVPVFYFEIGSVELFNEQLKEAQKDFDEKDRVSVSYSYPIDHVGEIFGWLFPIIIIVAIWLFIFKRMSGGAGAGGQGIFSIGKSRAKVFDKEGAKIKVNFKDVAGLEEAKMEITEIVDFLKNPKKYTKLGGKIPKGALLVGPPGTGKTLLAKAVAGEADVPFFSMSGSDFVEMFVGVGASRVRDLFQQAKQKSPCIIFIDEIDAIGRARGRNPNFNSNDERENTLNQLLTEMDGFDTNTGVIILAATNRVDVLDQALLRAGRFDRQIHVELPDLREREEIFKVHLKPIAVDKKLEISLLAKQTPGFSGADIANVCNEAALIAARNDKKVVEKQDFLDAVDRIVGGLEKKNKLITPSEKKAIAYHEAGHASVSWLLEHAHPLVKVTIVPRGMALGAAWYLPKERQITTQEQILDEMCAALGGRASEEVFFGKISTGALNDLEKVTKQAYAMMAYYGMSERVGNISFYDSQRGEYSFQKPYSEKTAEIIDQEVKQLVDEQYLRAKTIITENKEGLIELAELLLDKEVIFTEDVERIFGKREYHDEDIDLVKRVTKTDTETKDEEVTDAAEVENNTKTETDTENEAV